MTREEIEQEAKEWLGGHEYVDGDTWYSCGLAIEPGSRSDVPGSGCSDERVAGKECTCGYDDRLSSLVALIKRIVEQARQEEEKRWTVSLGHPSPDAVWTHVNKRRGERDAEVLQVIEERRKWLARHWTSKDTHDLRRGSEITLDEIKCRLFPEEER